MHNKHWLILLSIFLLWRVLLFGLSPVADHLLLYQPSFPYAQERLAQYGVPRWLYSWANFDGVHYLTIAENGYIGTGLIQAFFPFLPFVLLHLPKLILGSYPTLSVGLIITNLSALALVFIWYFFVRRVAFDKYFSTYIDNFEQHNVHTRNKKIARWSLATLFLFPTAFFFGALYTESLFFCLVLLSFWSAHKKKWLVASICAAFASVTRIVGILLLPALLVELYQQVREEQHEGKGAGQKIITSRHFLTQASCLLLSTVGLGAYMLFLWQEFHDPLYFMHVQSAFGSGRQESLVLYPQVVWRSLKILFTTPFDLRYLSYVQEAIVGIGGFLALLWCACRVRLSYTVFALGAFLVPTLTGNFSSMPRYFLVCFPFFLVLGRFFAYHKKIGMTALFLSLLLLIFNTILFLQGYWVA